MKTKRLKTLLTLSGLLFAASIVFALFQMIFYLNFWYLLLAFGCGLIASFTGVKWAKYCSENSDQVIKDLKDE